VALEPDEAGLHPGIHIEVVGQVNASGATLEQRPFAEAEVRDGLLYLCGARVAWLALGEGG